jgi:hypothetical protein
VEEVPWYRCVPSFTIDQVPAIGVQLPVPDEKLSDNKVTGLAIVVVVTGAVVVVVVGGTVVVVTGTVVVVTGTVVVVAGIVVVVAGTVVVVTGTVVVVAGTVVVVTGTVVVVTGTVVVVTGLVVVVTGTVVVVTGTVVVVVAIGAVTSRNAAVNGPANPVALVPRTNTRCRPTLSPAVGIAPTTASDDDENKPSVAFIGVATPPAQGGVSTKYSALVTF